MKLCNLIVTSKGGVGKSFVAWVLAQWGESKGFDMHNLDTDPANPTFAGYKALNVQYLDIANDKMLINRDVFDDLLEIIAEHEGFSVVDTGSTTFYPFLSHAMEVRTFNLLKKAGVRVVVHAPIAGGPALKETLVALEALLETTDVDVVIWLNGHFGSIELNGKPITETQLYKKYSARILGIVNISSRERDTHGKDFEFLLGNKLTFAEIPNHKFKLAQQQRYADVQNELFEQLDRITF
jgi:hypothetical protein